MSKKLFFFLNAIAISAQVSTAQESFNTNVTEVANRLSGTYQNTRQAKNPSYVLVKVDSCPVVVDNDGKYICRTDCR